jgi:cystathionine beta-lyase/cystathionine gamma-synthase
MIQLEVMPLFSNVNICSNKSWKPVGDYGYSRSANPTRTALEERWQVLKMVQRLFIGTSRY